MAYDNTVPQATSQISVTQRPILNNFQFLQTGIGEEHNFNTAGTGSDMYHLQASMPNQALLAAFPVDPGAVNGCYYVSDGIAYYFDGTLNYPLNPFCIRAAVNFNGVPSTPVIRSNFNVTSVTAILHAPLIVGYQVNFTTPMPSVNYCVLITGGRSSSDATIFGCIRGSTTSYGGSGSPVQLNSVEVEFFDDHGDNKLPFIGNVMVFGG